MFQLGRCSMGTNNQSQSKSYGWHIVTYPNRINHQPGGRESILIQISTGAVSSPQILVFLIFRTIIIMGNNVFLDKKKTGRKNWLLHFRSFLRTHKVWLHKHHGSRLQSRDLSEDTLCHRTVSSIGLNSQVPSDICGSALRAKILRNCFRVVSVF